MSQLKLIENAIKTSSLPIDGIGTLPTTHQELILAFSYKHNNMECFEKAFLSINFSASSIKTKANLVNWLITHNVNETKDFPTLFNNLCIQKCLHEGIMFDLSVVSKKLKNVNLYKVFPYCQNLTTNDFNVIFVEPIVNQQYKDVCLRIYDILDYHKKYNRDIPLKFFENLCKIIIPRCVMAEEKNPQNEDLKECREAIKEFIEYFSDKFNFFDNIPKSLFISMTQTHFPSLSPVATEGYYNYMREHILNKKLSNINTDVKVVHKSKKI